MHADKSIYFDQDYSAAVMKKRSQYTGIRKELRERKIKSHFVYPARLKVFTNGGEQVFNTATEATAALQAQSIIGTHSRAHYERPVPSGEQAAHRGKNTKADDKTAELLKKLTGKERD
jgi:hypothetical protein